MNGIKSDTHHKMEMIQIQMLRKASPAKKLAMLAELNSAARLLAMSGLRSRHPQLSDEQLKLRMATLLLGEALANKVYGEQSPNP